MKSTLVTDLGALYVSTVGSGLQGKPLAIENVGSFLADQHGDWAPGPTGFDMIVEASGDPEVIHNSLHLLAHGGIMVLTSITGADTPSTVRFSKLNIDVVLGNKTVIGVVNAHKLDFEAALAALVNSEKLKAGWRDRLLTHPFEGIEGCAKMVDLLMSGDSSVLKAHSIVAPEYLAG